jgi:hypothetical protein
MKALPVTLYIHHSASQGKYYALNADIPKINTDYTLIDTRTVEVEFDEPSKIELVNLQVDHLRNVKSRIAADAHIKQSAIDDKIQSLLCIEQISETPEPDVNIPDSGEFDEIPF